MSDFIEILDTAVARAGGDYSLKRGAPGSGAPAAALEALATAKLALIEEQLAAASFTTGIESSPATETRRGADGAEGGGAQGSSAANDDAVVAHIEARMAKQGMTQGKSPSEIRAEATEEALRLRRELDSGRGLQQLAPGPATVRSGGGARDRGAAAIAPDPDHINIGGANRGDVDMA